MLSEGLVAATSPSFENMLGPIEQVNNLHLGLPGDIDDLQEGNRLQFGILQLVLQSTAKPLFRSMAQTL